MTNCDAVFFNLSININIYIEIVILMLLLLATKKSLDNKATTAFLKDFTTVQAWEHKGLKPCISAELLGDNSSSKTHRV